MIQRPLLPDLVGADRWRPAVQPCRVQPVMKRRRSLPLPGQMFLPGIEQPQRSCPNCGGMEFDEDGDCTSCWEPLAIAADYRKQKSNAPSLSRS
jgi:hypothetical protein